MPCGQFNTVNIIEHRNEKVIKKGLGSPTIPGRTTGGVYSLDEYVDLNDKITTAQSQSKLQVEASLYPAASYCYCYTPTIKTGETLSDKFVKHNWYLPSLSELLYIWKCSWPDKIGANDNPYGLGKCQALIDAGVWVEPTAWGAYEGPSYWSSCQSGTAEVRVAQFRTTSFRGQSYDATTGGSTSISRYYIRACAKF